MQNYGKDGLNNIMDIIRKKVLQSYHKNGTYSHIIPFEISNYIDGLFHNSIMAGSAKLFGDTEIQQKAENWINILLSIDKNARNFDVKYHGGWEKNSEYYWIKKPQSFAGPAALHWAINQGCNLECPWGTIKIKAKLFSYIPSWIIRYIKCFNQHLNSCMLSYLVLNKKCNSNWNWAIEKNAFYSYINGKKCEIPIFTIFKSNSETVSEIVNIKNRKGSSWIWKQWPYKMGIDFIEGVEYTPISLLSAYYLQNSL